MNKKSTVAYRNYKVKRLLLKTVNKRKKAEGLCDECGDLSLSVIKKKCPACYQRVRNKQKREERINFAF